MRCIGNLAKHFISKEDKSAQRQLVEVVNGVDKEKLAIKGNQKEEQLLDTVMRKARDDYILFKCKEEIRMLEELLREPKSEEEITAKGEEMLITSKETEMTFNCEDNSVLVGDEEDTHEAEIMEMEDILYFESKSEVQMQYEDE